MSIGFLKISYFFTLLINNSDNNKMQGMTVKSIGAALGISQEAAKMRLRKHGIKPIEYAGPTAIYDPSCLDVIRETEKRGPKKDVWKNF
jgi:hypothetical protein